MAEDLGCGQHFGLTQQNRRKLDLPTSNLEAQLPKPSEDLLLHLPSHARLLGSTPAWSVGVGVRREGPVLLRGLVEAEARPDLIVLLAEGRHGSGILGVQGNLLGGQQQLGTHVPINAAQPLEREHGARPSSERLVVEDQLIGFHKLFLVLGQLCMPGCQLGEDGQHVVGIAQIISKAAHAIAVDIGNMVDPTVQDKLHARQCHAVSRDGVAVHEVWEVPIWVQREAVLVLAV
mmetsp:Transcript_4001/g.7100  ORF Transcript_4001/g.7100 Transcript_4001/m.7100 type:complete len:233 (+) Transcript_4001:1145-1843(+)